MGCTEAEREQKTKATGLEVDAGLHGSQREIRRQAELIRSLTARLIVLEHSTALLLEERRTKGCKCECLPKSEKAAIPQQDEKQAPTHQAVERTRVSPERKIKEEKNDDARMTMHLDATSTCRPTSAKQDAEVKRLVPSREIKEATKNAQGSKTETKVEAKQDGPDIHVIAIQQAQTPHEETQKRKRPDENGDVTKCDVVRTRRKVSFACDDDVPPVPHIEEPKAPPSEQDVEAELRVLVDVLSQLQREHGNESVFVETLEQELRRRNAAFLQRLDVRTMTEYIRKAELRLYIETYTGLRTNKQMIKLKYIEAPWRVSLTPLPRLQSNLNSYEQCACENTLHARRDRPYHTKTFTGPDVRPTDVMFIVNILEQDGLYNVRTNSLARYLRIRTIEEQFMTPEHHQIVRKSGHSNLTSLVQKASGFVNMWVTRDSGQGDDLVWLTSVRHPYRLKRDSLEYFERRRAGFTSSKPFDDPPKGLR